MLRKRTCQIFPAGKALNIQISRYPNIFCTFQTTSNLGIQSNLIEVTSGTTCELRIRTKAECEEAATQLGLSDTTATEVSMRTAPPFCYLKNGNALYFNNRGNANGMCESNMVCVCKKPGTLSVINRLNQSVGTNSFTCLRRTPPLRTLLPAV